jgi:polyphenol oxidase
MRIEANSLKRLAPIRHAFFTREGGVSSGLHATLNAGLGSQDRPENVAENRRRMAEALGVSSIVTAYQIHSPNVVVADRPWTREQAPRADAVVTQIPGLAVGVTTADCGPVLFADPEAGVVGAAHAGWKGALGGVLESTIDEMVRLGAERARIFAALGPMIRQPNYEVGPVFVRSFEQADRANARFFKPAERPGRARFDLPGFIAARLEAAGIRRIEDLGVCTYADEQRFFSFRRTTHRGEPDYGRHVNAIAIASG